MLSASSGRLSLDFALQVKLSEFMMEFSCEFYSNINIFPRVAQNQLSQKIPQASHVMSTPLSLMESSGELYSDINIFHRVVQNQLSQKIPQASHVMSTPL